MKSGISNILDLLQGRGGRLNLNGLVGASRGLLLAELKRRFCERPVLVVTSSAESAERLLDDCAVFFHPEDLKSLRSFPESSVLPYSHLSPEPEAWADRLGVLYDLIHDEPLVVVAPVEAVMRRVPPKSFVENGSRTIRLKEEIDPAELAKFLSAHGYEDVGLVEDEGTFARRGGIIDIWTPTSNLPVRLELDGDRIASMRYFDPATQRSKNDCFEIVVIPVRDFAFDPDSRKSAARRIRARAEEKDLPAREWRTVVEAIIEGIAFSGIETYMPLFHEQTSTVFGYLRDAFVIVDEVNDTDGAVSRHEGGVQDAARETQSTERMIDPRELVLSPGEFSSEVNKFAGMNLNALATEGKEVLNADTAANTDIRAVVAGHKTDEDMLSPLSAKIKDLQSEGFRITLTCHTELQASRLSDLFRLHGMELKKFEAPFKTVFSMTPATLNMRIGRVSSGFRWSAEKIAVISDEEIFGAKVARRAPVSRPMEPFTSFTEISEGDFIVHEKHGIGRFLRLVHMEIENIPGDYLLLEYLGGDKLYLPVYRLNLVGRYIGSGDSPPFLDKLGGMRWGEIRKKVDASVRLMANELLGIYAAREVYPGFPFPDGGMQYEEFSAAFPYDETPDQARAIDDVMRDMGIERPMDRLVCGDVGYGKTEVAMRAAFRAAMAGKQVAVLVPTTVLALQHYESFTLRFKETPVAIEMLSRFRTAKTQKETVEKLSRGAVDIVIGTHRLLQKDVRFRELGLLIIDEEHRFGVRHKERIKKMKSSVDVITLTATPIPRTLNLSLTGVRDISVINTPPLDRHAIATYVAPFDEGIIRGAIIKELARGGQIFFVHNRVETIGSMHARLKRLVPEAQIVVGHGQLKEGELERVMIDFLERRADVLLCTTIIESGLDIPNANTIVINRADTFGLAQLYQLRGRVGRSKAHAFAYLLTPEEGEITPIAKKRLTVLTRFTELGSGFQIAMHDLEFRGAGNLLGSAQSGHIAAVGYEMYARLLERAMRKLKGKKVEEEIDPELNLKIPAFLPEDYVPDPGTRIDLYRRLANRETAEEIASLGEELVDRFGTMPAEAANLIAVMEIKVIARGLKIRQATSDGTTLLCEFDPSTPLRPEHIMKLADKGAKVRFLPPDKLLIATADEGTSLALLGSVKNTLNALTACATGM